MSDDAISRKLAGTWRRERLYTHARGACHVLVWIVALLLVDLLIDWSLDLSASLRGLLLLSNLVLLAIVVRRQWLRGLRGYDAARVALRVEASHPELESVLISHVQLPDAPREGEPVSPALLAALHRRAREDTRRMDFGRIVDFRRLRTPLVAAGIAALVLAVSAVGAGEHCRVLLARLLWPPSAARYPTRTVIEDVPGDLTVRQGDPLEIRVRASGECPAAGLLWLRPEGGGWESVALQRVQDGPDEAGDGTPGEVASYAWREPSCARGFDYLVEVGDAATDEFRVVAVPAPRVVEASVRVEAPPYTGVEPREVSVLDFEALEGSTVAWEVRCDRPLAAAELVRDGSPVRLSIDPSDPSVARGRLDVAASLSYHLRWVDREHAFRYDDPVRHSVRVRPDRPPRVVIVEPRQDGKATVRKRLRITFEARDDYGTAEAWLVHAVDDRPETRRPLGSLRDAPAGPMAIEWRPAEDIPDLREGMAISWAIEVSDARSAGAGPQRGRSRVMRLEVVSVTEYLEHLSERKARLFSNVKGVLHDEVTGSRNVKTIQEEIR